jgi:hypothetical protein
VHQPTTLHRAPDKIIFKTKFDRHLFLSFIQPLVVCKWPADIITLFQVPFAVEVSLIDGDSAEVVSCFGFNGNVVA